MFVKRMGVLEKLASKMMKAVTLKPSVVSAIVYSVLHRSTLDHTLSGASVGNNSEKTNMKSLVNKSCIFEGYVDQLKKI